jgi:hypothetical protein
MQLPAGIMQPTTPHEVGPPSEEEQGAESSAQPTEALASEARTPSVRRRKAKASAAEKVEGRRLYLTEDVHFRLRMLAYQRGRKISEVAQEVLDKALPRYDVNRVG